MIQKYEYYINDNIKVSLKPHININKIIYQTQRGYLAGSEVMGDYEEIIFTSNQCKQLITLMPEALSLLEYDKYKVFTLLEDETVFVEISGYKESEYVCFVCKNNGKYKNTFHYHINKNDLLIIVGIFAKIYWAIKVNICDRRNISNA
jgi:hypothetical protein